MSKLFGSRFADLGGWIANAQNLYSYLMKLPNAGQQS